MKQSKKRPWKLNVLIVVGLAAATMLFAPHAEAKEYRFRAQVDEPFEVHGLTFDAGMLTIREFGDLNPTSTLHEISLGKSSLGMLVGKTETSGESAEHDALIFKRNSSGTLVLVGVNFRGHPTRELYHFDDASDPHAWVRPDTSMPAGMLTAR